MGKNPESDAVGRFAPSPTGALHTGSLATAVGSYLMAKQAGGRWLLRLDDLDAQRQVPGMADDIMRTLESFGLFWDGEVARQSRNLQEYRRFFDTLQQSGLIYPCGCSRKEITRSASAPHIEDDCIPYSGICRGGIKGEVTGGVKEGSTIRSWRVRVQEEEICFDDLRKGCVCQTLPGVSGDFILKRGDGEFAYQLAVVVDDYLAGVNQVVRGDDLLASTPRQIYLQRLLGFPQPDYCHLPLVAGPDGSKLSKRDHLVSHLLGNESCSDSALLLAVFRFLGLNPLPELAGYSCSAILEWGCAHFESLQLPARGCTLAI